MLNSFPMILFEDHPVRKVRNAASAGMKARIHTLKSLKDPCICLKRKISQKKREIRKNANSVSAFAALALLPAVCCPLPFPDASPISLV